VLEVSRSDVNKEELVDFPLLDRFIKLPIKNYLKLLGAYDDLNRPQIALINAINDPKYRFVCAALSRRIGKTYISNIIAQLVVLVPGCNVLIISPNYNLSAISFELQRRFIAHFEVEVERDNLKDKVIELCNQSTVRMGSITTVDSVVGRSYDLIIFDEAALASGGIDAFNIQLRPTLDKIGSKAIFISTPRGSLNWFSQFYSRGFSSDFPQWCSITADYHENPRMSEADVAEAKKSMSKAEFEQEYLASFNTFEGQIFNFNKDCIKPFSSEKGDESIAGLDPGYKDATAYIVVIYREMDQYLRSELIIESGEVLPIGSENPAYIEGHGTFHVVDEYVNHATTEVHALAIQKLIDKWDTEIIFIDSAAAQVGADLTYTYDIGTTLAKKAVLPGIGYAQSLVEQDRLLVESHCTHTLAALDQYRWDTRDTLLKERPFHDDHSHIADALRYALYSFTI
jgi:hypothetical protein